MQERQKTKPEIAAQKRTIKLAPAIGDWTTYKPPKVLVKKVKTGLYGFDRLSREELNLFLLIHYQFIEEVLKRFKIDLKMGVELYSVSAEQTTYLNFLRTLSGPVAQLKISLGNSHEAIALILDLSLANSIINYALGSQDLEPINRALTEAENTTLAAAIGEYLPSYAAVFQNIIQTPSLSVISSPDISIEASINTSATFVTFNAQAAMGNNAPGRILIGYLGGTLKSLLAKYKQKEKPLNFSRFSPSFLAKINIPAKVMLGQTSLTTGEINRMETGDVVLLDTSIDSPSKLVVGKKLTINCQPGAKEKKKAVRITAVREEDKGEITPPALEAEEEPVKPAGPAKSAESQTQPAPKKDVLEQDFDEEFPEDDLLDEEFPEDDITLEDDLEEEEDNP